MTSFSSLQDSVYENYRTASGRLDVAKGLLATHDCDDHLGSDCTLDVALEQIERAKRELDQLFEKIDAANIDEKRAVRSQTRTSRNGGE